jgi:hypothetical protein
VTPSGIMDVYILLITKCLNFLFHVWPGRKAPSGMSLKKPEFKLPSIKIKKAMETQL